MNLFPDNLGFNIGTGINITRKIFTMRPEVVYYFSPFNILESENLYAPFKAIHLIQRNYIEFRLNVFKKYIDF